MEGTFTILAVDDSITVRKMIEILLKPDGYEIVTAETGQEGLRLCQSKPDLILLDYILPDMRGTEFCEKLSTDTSTSQIPVMMVSGKGNEIRSLYRKFPNIIDYITKPIAPNVLKAVVAQAVTGITQKETTAKQDPVSDSKLLSDLNPNTQYYFPAKMVPLRNVVDYLTVERKTGKLSVQMESEVIDIYVDGGEIDLITSNHSGAYCETIDFDFGSIPREDLSTALQKQKKEGIPLFITLREKGHIQDLKEYQHLLRASGKASFNRASAAEDAVIQFTHTKDVPDWVKRNIVSESLINLLLSNYRSQFQTTSRYTNGFHQPSRKPIRRHQHFEYYYNVLELQQQEKDTLELINDQRNITEISELLGIDEEEIDYILKPFLQLGIINM